jgi:hypothetical protein
MKTKNKIVPIILFFSVFLLTVSCISSSTNEETNTESDTLKTNAYKRYVDSMKQRNPLLILPPDTEYTGEYIDRWPNGLVKFRGYFRFGKRHGQWVSFFENGEPWSEVHYDKGLRHGPYMVYYPGLKKRIEGYYKNDMRDSIWCFYDSSGSKIREILFRRNVEIQRKNFIKKK